MVANVSTDDLVNSLLNSVNSSSPTSSSTNSTASSSVSTFVPSSSSLRSANSSNATPSPVPSPNTLTPIRSDPDKEPSLTPEPPIGSTKDDSDDHSGSNAGLSIGITIGVLALIIASLLFLRSKRKCPQQKRESVSSPSMGAACLSVPSDRGFTKERDLGMPEMSIELPPGELGLSKMSYASSARSSATSNYQSNSSDSSVFNTKGGVSPTFSTRKNASYSYQYRESEENHSNMAASTTFHLTGMIGNGQASGRNLTGSRALGSRKLSAPDEYAELVTATNAHTTMEMDPHAQSPEEMLADFTQSSTSHNELEMSMGPDADNQSSLAPLPTRSARVSVRSSTSVNTRASEESMGPDAESHRFMPSLPTRPVPASTRRCSTSTLARASEESMGPDSPTGTYGNRTGIVYTVPEQSRIVMAAPMRGLSEDDPNAMLTASFLSESSMSSISTRDSASTLSSGSTFANSMVSSSRANHGEDPSTERASTSSSQHARSGSLIALNLEAKEGSSEIAI